MIIQPKMELLTDNGNFSGKIMGLHLTNNILLSTE